LYIDLAKALDSDVSAENFVPNCQYMASVVIYMVCLKTSFGSITVHRIDYTYSSEISLSSCVGLIHGTCLGSLLRVLYSTLLCNFLCYCQMYANNTL